MKNKLLGVSAVAAAAGLVSGGPANAAVEPVRMQAQSFAELLQPIPNATEQLKIADMQAAREEPRLIEAQYYNNHHHHHHHHHHHNRRWYLRNGYYWYGGAWVLRPRDHHHHHHHHHNNYPDNPPPPRPY